MNDLSTRFGFLIEAVPIEPARPRARPVTGANQRGGRRSGPAGKASPFATPYTARKGRRMREETITVLFEAAGAEDWETLLALAKAMNAEDGHPLDGRAEAAVRGVLSPETQAWAWFAREVPGGPALGYVTLCAGYSIEHGGRDGFVDELYVIPQARGSGLGARLMAFAEKAAREKGIGTLHLEVERENARAQSLYRTRGYGDTGRILMSKRLA